MSMADRDGVIWYDGKLVPWRDATTHVLTHSLHYGLAVFEGLRAYKTDAGTAIFRLKEHTERFFKLRLLPLDQTDIERSLGITFVIALADPALTLRAFLTLSIRVDHAFERIHRFGKLPLTEI